ncbi:MAG: YceH family protein [Holophagales bacterium]|nr:YceH family protein [Holophagales bacterium]
MKLPRPLDPVEIRVAGALLEKELLTPDVYPMTLQGLVAACNQRTSREPVTDLSAADVTGGLDRLRELVLAWKVTGGRSDKWEHNLDAKWQLGTPGKALVALLLLRGPQTAAELRARSERMHDFASVEAAEELLGTLAAHSEPLVVELPRRPGQKETRWTHLVGGAPAEEPFAPRTASPTGPSAIERRLLALEERLGAVEAELAALKGSLGA